MPYYDNQVDVMYTAEQLQARIAELGQQIANDFRGQELTVVSVLKGSVLFFSDLVRAIDLPLTIDFLGLSSYAGTESTGVVRITNDLSKPIQDRNVLVVEDIIDTGLTMDFLLENLKTRHPKSVSVCSLLEKPSRAKKKIDIHYKGFVIPDAFVVGYGLDYDEKFRNLPFIGVFRRQA